MLKTVKFNEIDSYEDLGLILTSSNIEAPSPKTNTVEIDGADGSVDYTEAFGDVFYGNRKLSFDFTYAGNPETYADKFSELQNKLHGERMKIVISDDPDFWYVGRVTVDRWKSSKAVRRITVDCDCEPYKYQNVIRKYEITSNPQTIKFKNLRMMVYPKLLADSAVGILCNGKNVVLSAGVASQGVIRFTKGDNTLVVSGGSCNLTIESLRGSL